MSTESHEVMHLSTIGARVAVASAFVGLVGATAGGSLWLKHVGEDAIRAESDLGGVTTEVLRQDGLEWRAISGSPPPTLRQDLRESRSRARELLASAGRRGLPVATTRAVAGTIGAYSSAVDRELVLLDQGRAEEAVAWDETRVDPRFEILVDQLGTAAGSLRTRGSSLSLWSNVGLVATLLLALAIAALLQRRVRTDRQRLEQDLVSEARYRAIIEESQDLVIVTDGRGRLDYLSPAAHRVLTRAGAGDLRQRRLDQLVPPEVQDRVSTLLQDAVAEGDPAPVDLRFLAPGQEHAPVFQFTARDLTSDRLVRGIVLTGRDVTRDRELEETKSDLVSTVSHELRTPLTSIRGYLELLQAGDLGPIPEQQRSAITVVDRNAGRLLSLIDQLLILSGIDSGSEAGPGDLVDVVGLVEGVVVEARELATDHRLDLGLPSGHRGPARVRGDAEGLRRVFSNLVSNAIKFSPAGGLVVVTAEVGDHAVDVRFADHGIGIPVEDQARLFTRFFRASAAKVHAIPGTGLGLAVCREIVAAHDGSIRVVSEAGVGSEFTVSLPLAVPLPEDPDLDSSVGGSSAARPIGARSPLTRVQP